MVNITTFLFQVFKKKEKKRKESYDYTILPYVQFNRSSKICLRRNIYIYVINK